jgi:hypothetical protein
MAKLQQTTRALAIALAGIGIALTALMSGASAADFWAVVKGNGDLIRGKGVASSIRLGKGGYEVLFARRVDQCAYEGTLAIFGAGALPEGHIGLSPRSNKLNGVFVATWDSAGTLWNNYFHLFISCPPITSNAKDRWASVTQGGALLRGKGAVSSQHLASPGTGRYEVIFDKNISQCATLASLGGPTSQSILSLQGEIDVIGLASNPKGVLVRTRDPAGAAADRPFYLHVGCGGATSSAAASAQDGTPRTAAGDRWAVVRPDGTLARSFGATASGRSEAPAGAYFVEFDKNVRKCGLVATLATATATIAVPNGFVTAVPVNGLPNRVFVATSAPGLGLADLPFHLTVSCAQ